MGLDSPFEVFSILIHYMLFGRGSGSVTKAIDYSAFISMIKSTNQFSHEVELFTEYLREQMSQFERLNFLHKYYFLEEYNDAISELCTKSISDDEFSKMFASFCFASRNFKMQSAEMLKKIDENSTIKYLMEVDKKLKAEIYFFD